MIRRWVGLALGGALLALAAGTLAQAADSRPIPAFPLDGRFAPLISEDYDGPAASGYFLVPATPAGGATTDGWLVLVYDEPNSEDGFVAYSVAMWTRFDCAGRTTTFQGLVAMDNDNRLVTSQSFEDEDATPAEDGSTMGQVLDTVCDGKAPAMQPLAGYPAVRADAARRAAGR